MQRFLKKLSFGLKNWGGFWVLGENICLWRHFGDMNLPKNIETVMFMES